MQLAVQGDAAVFGPSLSDAPSARRSTKLMVAGVAMASAGIIAVNPVAPITDIERTAERAAQAAAVQLSAATNPLLVLSQTVGNTFGSLSTLVPDATAALLDVAGQLSTGAIIQETLNVLVANVLNPGPLFNELVNFNANFGATIETALNSTRDRSQLAAEQLPIAIQDMFTELSQGHFFEAFSKINGWFVLRYLGSMQPLIPLFSIPSQIVAALPGAERLPAVMDVLSEFALTKAIFEPIVGSLVSVTESLDKARHAFVTGDLAEWTTHLVNLPILAVDALLNGIVPAAAAPGTAEWQGLLDRGLFSYLLVTLPTAIANALTPPAPAPTVQGLSAPSDINLSGGNLVPVSLTDEGEDDEVDEADAAKSADEEPIDEGADGEEPIDEGADDEEPGDENLSDEDLGDEGDEDDEDLGDLDDLAGDDDLGGDDDDVTGDDDTTGADDDTTGGDDDTTGSDTGDGAESGSDDGGSDNE
ncbi:hypothetical protein [Mycolicibacterium phlei]